MSNPIIGKPVDPVIFRVYVGVKPFKFPDIVDTNIDEIHIILAFSHETYNKNGKGTGYFHADDWDQSVKDIKHQHPNVKVVFSIGGRDAKYPFSPIEKDDWCKNAVDSLKTIIQQYNFDGIDINYEHIKTKDEKDFSNYFGDVITRLKKEVGIHVVSIAPSLETDKHYKQLYKEHSDDIDWVNYQFYTQTLPNKDEFVNLFYSLSKEYTPKKILVGASAIDPRDAGNLSLDVFMQGCTDLFKRNSLSGIFIWNVNDSKPDNSLFSITGKISLDIYIHTPFKDFHYHHEWTIFQNYEHYVADN